jgi:hypothetical protein
MDQLCKHIFNRIYSFKMHINSSIINEQKHITQQMIKEFTPLLGYISWSSFQWIISIICSKCSKMCFTMLKMTNRLLQWLQNIQKPLAGIFGTSLGQKMKKIGFLEVPPSSFLSLHLQNAPPLAQPIPHAI